MERAELRREIEQSRALTFDTEALRLHGLRSAPESEANYVEMVNLLEQVEEEMEKGDYATLLPGLLRTLYGDQPASRGAALQSLVAELNRPDVVSAFTEQRMAALRIGLAQESHAVMREYVGFSRQRKDITPLLRESSLAAGNDLQQLNREEASIDRQIARKIRLLAEMQKARCAGLAPSQENLAAAEAVASEPEAAEEDCAPESAGREEG